MWEAEPLRAEPVEEAPDAPYAPDLVFEAEAAVFQLNEASSPTQRPFEFNPQPSRALRAASPFGELGIPVSWVERWRSFGEQEGLFPFASILPQPRRLAAAVSTGPVTAAPPREAWALQPAPQAEVLEEAAVPSAVDRKTWDLTSAGFEHAAPTLSEEQEAEELFEAAEAELTPMQPASGWFRPEEIRLAVERELAVEALPEEATQLATAAETSAKSPDFVAEAAWRSQWSESPAETEREVLAATPLQAAEESFFSAEPAALESAATAPELQAATEEEPSSWVLGKLYLDQGHLEEAEREFRRVLAERPGQPEALAGLEEVAVRRQGTLTAPALSATERRLRALRGYLTRIQRFKEAWRVP